RRGPPRRAWRSRTKGSTGRCEGDGSFGLPWGSLWGCPAACRVTRGAQPGNLTGGWFGARSNLPARALRREFLRGFAGAVFRFHADFHVGAPLAHLAVG